jgi:hypothetical protein
MRGSRDGAVCHRMSQCVITQSCLIYRPLFTRTILCCCVRGQYALIHPPVLHKLLNNVCHWPGELESVPLEYEIPWGETGKATLQRRVERIFPAPVTVNAEDCVVVI